jgi:hypothetical protein
LRDRQAVPRNGRAEQSGISEQVSASPSGDRTVSFAEPFSELERSRASALQVGIMPDVGNILVYL